MSSFWYDLALQGFLSGSFDLLTANIKVALVTSSYTPNQATDQFLSAVGAAVAVKSPNLASVTVADGVFGAANTTFTSVPSAVTCNALVVFIDTGTTSTSPLLLYLDSTLYSGLPITLNGANVNLSFSPTGNLIFSL